MNVEITAPCCLHLGFVWADGVLSELGIALKHPQTQLSATLASQWLMSGPCAETMLPELQKFAHTKAFAPVEITIEMATPLCMGLGAVEMIRAAACCAVERLHQAVTDNVSSSIYASCFVDGGLVVRGQNGALARQELQAGDDAEAWIVVLVLPDAPDDVTSLGDYEMARHNQLHESANGLAREVKLESLWRAGASDDIDAFAQALRQIHHANEDALAKAGFACALQPEAEATFKIMREHGALMWAQTLTGVGLYGLIQGAPASRVLRKALQDHFGYGGPIILASVCDNAGAQITQTR